jgi:hypothetical protein
MTERRDAVRQPARGPLPSRSRKRWLIAGGVAACWVVLLIVTGSAVMATVVLVLIAGLGAAAVLGLRGLGVTRDHPWVQRFQPEPSYRGPEPSYRGPEPSYRGPEPSYRGPGYAPAYPGPELDYDVPEYEPPAPAYAGPGPVRDDDPPWRGFAVIDGETEAHPEAAFGEFQPTVMERAHTPVPMLRLVTGDAVAETRMSGAVAGRGNVELRLPQVPTVSREHARFTFSDGQWRIANLGMNGLTVNGAPLAGEQPVSTDDEIRWGTRPDALLSRVQIG